MTTDFYAIDFGTSNSLLTHINSKGEIQHIPLDHDGDTVLKSLIFSPNNNEWYFGKEAIEMREENDGEGRFFRSIKKFLPEPNYKGTEVHGRIMTIDKLISVFLRGMKEKADKVVGKKVTNVVLGRPALYSLDPSKDQLAEDRMRKAAKLAGFDNIIFCPEPLAAGLNIGRKDKSENFMIADFGGGTSDFTILRVHEDQYDPKDVLGLSGIFQAGDALDGRMMKDFIAKHFGAHIEYKIPFSENILKFPRKLMLILCSPAHISVLRERETWELLKEIKNYSLSEENQKQMDQLFTLVEEQQAYPIYQEIERTKIALSSHPEATYHYDYPGIQIKEIISDEIYRESLTPVINKIKDSMMESFEKGKLSPTDIDRVFITGGTGQSPYIKEMLIEVFGKDKIFDGEVFQSVINGLSEYAKLQLNPQS